MRTLKLSVLILFMALLPATAASLSPQVTLGEALRAALGERPMLLAAEADVAAAKAASLASASRYLPRLTLSEQFYATNEPGGSLFIDLNQQSLDLSPTAEAYNDPPSRHDFETRLTLSQPLFDPQLKYGKERASVRQQASTSLLQRRREETAFAALQAYLAVQQSRAHQQWAVQYLAEAEEIQKMARERETAGVGLRADTLRSEVLLYEARRTLLSARNKATLSRLRLALAMGLSAGEVDIAVPLDLTLMPLAENSAALQRGDLAALAQGAREAELAAGEQKSAFLPRASMQASYILHDEDMPFGADADAWSVTAGLQWTIFDFSERSHLVSQARARQRSLEQQRLEQERQIRLDVAEASLDAAESGLLLELAQRSLIAAEATREVMVPRYEAGLATLAELLEVQTTLARCRSDLASAEVNLIAARAQVHYQQGSLLQALKIGSEE